MNKKIDKKNTNNNENENENVNNIEVVIGDDTILDISEVNDCMNTLRPKDSIKNRKKFIIPLSKKKEEKNEDNK